MKKTLKIILIIVILGILFILIDSGIGFLRKKTPLIHWQGTIENGKKTNTLLYNIYSCYNLGEIRSTEFVSKKKEYICPESDIILKEENLNIYSYEGFFNKSKYIKKADTKDELKAATKYIKKFNKKYDDDFFLKKSILIAYVPVGSNATVTFNQILVSEDIKVKISIEKARADKTNTTGFAYFIEIDKEYLGDKKIILETQESK